MAAGRTVTRLRFEELLAATQAPDGTRRYEVGASMLGAFGGAFGGLLGAIGVSASRSVAQGRRPAAIDCRFVRGLPAGPVTVSLEVTYEGRTLTCVTADLADDRGRLCTRCTVSLVDGTALDDRSVTALKSPAIKPHADGVLSRGPAGVEAPILETLDARVVSERSDDGVSTSLVIPWDDTDLHEEAACVAADLCVGAPVALGMGSPWAPHPNPDLSLRFCGPVAGRQVVGTGTLAGIERGLAAVAIHVWSDGRLSAIGSSSSVLLGPR